MLNVIEVQDALKGMPMEQLIREMQMPSGQVPQFLVLSEITRRREMEKAYAQNQGQPQTTVAQDAVAAGGVPQGGIADMARAMAPQTDMSMNTGAMPQAPVQQMASGGYVQKMKAGGGLSTPPIQFMTDPSVREMASRQGVSVEEFWNSLSDEAKEKQLRTYADTQGIAEDGTLSRISDLPAAAQPPTFSPPAMFGGFSIPPESVPQRPTLGIQGYAREPSAYTPRGMGIDALLNIQNMAPNTVEGRQADYAARMAGEGAVAARRQGPIDAAAGRLMQQYSGLGIDEAQAMADYRRQLLGERALAGRVGMDTSGIDAPSVYDRSMTARELLEASAGPSAALHASPTSEAPPAAAPAQDAMTAFQENFGVYEDDGTVPGSALPGALELAFGREALERAGLGVSTPGGRPVEDMTPAASIAPPEVVSPPEAAPMMDTGTPLEMPEGGIEALLLPAATPVTPPAPTTPPAPPAGGGAGAGAGGGGAGSGIAGLGPIESRIAQMLAEREKSAEADKWLALAQAGLALMSSKQSTFGGALGEAGLVGLSQMKKARGEYDRDVLDLLQAQSNVQRASASAARTAASQGISASNLISRINSLEGDQRQLAVAISTAKNTPNMMGEPQDVNLLEQMFINNQMELQRLRGQLGGLGGASSVASDFDATTP